VVPGRVSADQLRHCPWLLLREAALPAAIPHLKKIALPKSGGLAWKTTP